MSRHRRSWPCSRCWTTPGGWRQGLDNLLAGWLAGAPDEVAGWTRRETGSYGFDMWSRAARVVTADGWTARRRFGLFARARTCAPGGRGRWWSALLDAMPGASEQTRRVKIVNANWVPGTAGRQEQFEVMIITEDDQRHVVPATAASVTAVVALARAGTVMAWDPEGGGMLIAANVVGEMPWTTRE